MVTAAQTAKAPFIRLADRYALVLLPITLAVAGAAWLLSGDSIRGRYCVRFQKSDDHRQ
jgi:cation transport ATPase